MLILGYVMLSKGIICPKNRGWDRAHLRTRIMGTTPCFKFFSSKLRRGGGVECLPSQT